MSSVFAPIIALLQTALVLLGIVSANPSLPQSARDSATQVASQAITQATQMMKRGTEQGHSTTSAAHCLLVTHDFSLDATDADTGGEVSRLQRFLSAEGEYDEPITGQLNTATSRALQHWQSAHNIAITKVDEGAIGPRTRVEMIRGCTTALKDRGSITALASISQPTAQEITSYVKTYGDNYDGPLPPPDPRIQRMAFANGMVVGVSGLPVEAKYLTGSTVYHIIDYDQSLTPDPSATETIFLQCKNVNGVLGSITALWSIRTQCNPGEMSIFDTQGHKIFTRTWASE